MQDHFYHLQPNYAIQLFLTQFQPLDQGQTSVGRLIAFWVPLRQQLLNVFACLLVCLFLFCFVLCLWICRKKKKKGGTCTRACVHQLIRTPNTSAICQKKKTKKDKKKKRKKERPKKKKKKEQKLSLTLQCQNVIPRVSAFSKYKVALTDDLRQECTKPHIKLFVLYMDKWTKSTCTYVRKYINIKTNSELSYCTCN